MQGVYLLKLGMHTLRGFRIGCRPALLGGWPEGYRALESAVADATEVLVELPYAELFQDGERVLRPPSVEGREGWIDVHCVQDAMDSLLVVTRAYFSFRWWPVGCWIVLAAFRRWPDRAERVPVGELDEMW